MMFCLKREGLQTRGETRKAKTLSDFYFITVELATRLTLTKILILSSLILKIEVRLPITPPTARIPTAIYISSLLVSHNGNEAWDHNFRILLVFWR